MRIGEGSSDFLADGTRLVGCRAVLLADRVGRRQRRARVRPLLNPKPSTIEQWVPQWVPQVTAEQTERFST